jgi:outer membrane protein OmpA-like peptidoglycan-associated protein
MIKKIMSFSRDIFFLRRLEMKNLIAAFLLISVFFSQSIAAQGDGPRAYLLAPKNVTGVSAKWMNMNQNIIPAGSALVPGADIRVDVFPIGLFHTFSLGGRFAQVLAVVTPGSATASAIAVPPSFPIPKTSLDASGISDGFVAFKLGLAGAPALNAVEFAKATMRFSVFGEARYWYSGTYESGKLFNLGTNRSTFQFLVPMAVPLNNNRAHATWLEIAPSLSFFAANNDPSRNPTPGSKQVQKVTQSPLFIIENHLSHNFTPKFWVVGNLRFQQGGQTSADGVKDDNTMSILGGGGGLGYQLLPFLGAYADYGGIIFGDKNAKSNLFRLSVTFSYVNKKKLEAEMKAKAQAATPVVVASVDTDKDGIADANDKCPNVAGLAKYDGCPVPDTDGDGIIDENDKCPTVAGTAKYQGCPVPDTDGDGINDENDKCPTVAGKAKYEGCPIPDTDGDSINDENDRCPKVAGIPGNLGCPEMILYYKRDVVTLSAEDKTNLDKVVAFLNNNPDINITLEGHTSTLGDAKYNQTLSEKRANNSVAYLVSKGIGKSRLTSVGYGEQFPIGDNTKEEGRAQSRRTVVKVAQ